MTTRRFVPLALGSAALLGLFLYGPTFGVSFAYDDVDYLNHASDVLAGRAPFWDVLFRPQGEHFVPVLRAYRSRALMCSVVPSSHAPTLLHGPRLLGRQLPQPEPDAMLPAA
jgi:hypothetical protein